MERKTKIVPFSKNIVKQEACENTAGKEAIRMERKTKIMPFSKNIAKQEACENTTGKETSFTEWVIKNITKRVCNKFVPVKDKNNEQEKLNLLTAKPKRILSPIRRQTSRSKEDRLCECGYKETQHTEEALKNESCGSWKAKDCTKEVKPTDAFGELEFSGYGQRISKYIRIDEKTKMNTMRELLVNGWQLKTPSLLISVTGGAKNFTMKPRLKEVFRRGLMKAAESTGAWITTGGMHAGVMKHVGEAVRDYMVTHGNKNKVVAIGIAPWGCVAGKECLISNEKKGLWPASYNVRDIQRKQSPLDPNHSHFILVDNGTQHKFGTEIEFRAKLESSISQELKSQEAGMSKVSIPLVCVVLEGGPGTLETVKSAIQNGTPAVIVEGSGRAADILAYAYSNSTEEEVEVTDKEGRKHKKVISIFDNELFEKVKKKIFDEWKDKDIDSRVTWVRECLDKRDHMTVFRLDHGNSAKDIDLAILQALLKVNKDKTTEQLRLALAWNRIDIAKNEIFTDEARWEPEELNELMFSAITKNLQDFVNLFIDNGVSLKDFLTVKRLLQLYNSIPRNSFLYKLLNKKRSSKTGVFSLTHIGQLISDLTGDFYQPLYLREPYSKIDSQKVLRQNSSDEFAVNPTDSTEDPANNGNHTSYRSFEEPARELFIWSVLNHKLEMARFFWEEGKHCIAAALTAQKITSSMREKTDDTELQKELMDREMYFSDLAVGVLSECYAGDERQARHLLVCKLPLFGNSTCVQLAVEADNRKFIAHAACQSLLSNIWMGPMQQDNPLWKLLLCAVFPFFVTWLIRFQPKSHHTLESLNPPEDTGKAADEPGQQTDVNDKREDHAVDRSGLRWYQKIKHFLTAPVIIFFYNCVSYVGFLLLFSYILLVKFVPDVMFTSGKISIQPLEILLIVWVFSFLTEEIRQLVMTDANKVCLKLRGYISNKWNVMDVISLLLFLTGMILRLIPIDLCTNQSCFTAARIIYGCDFMIFFFRVLHMFSVHKELGPKLDMIGQMMVDLAYFVIILMVFIAAYGIATQAMLYPGSTLNFSLIKDVLHRPYFQIFGELFLEEIEGDACPASGCSDPTSQWLVPIILGVYIMITNVLMLNLVIAMFSYTFGRIQERTDEHWKFQRYFLIKEYYDRPPLFPPLILFSHIFLVLRYLSQKSKCKCGSLSFENVFNKNFNDNEVRQLTMWENMYADEYVRRIQTEEMNCEQNRIKAIDDRVAMMSQQVNQMAEVSLLMQTGNQPMPVNYKLPPVLNDRLVYLEEQLRRTAKALDWIIDSMVMQNAKSERPSLPDVDECRKREQERKEEIKRKRKQEFEEMLERQLALHIKSRSKRYPTTNRMIIERFTVPNEKVPWEETWKEYDPVDYTDPEILKNPEFADIDLKQFPPHERPQLPFNAIDTKLDVNRISFCGTYEVIEGIPRNPKGRTGLCGRGVLGRWGPNHAGDPVITRWHRDSKGSITRDFGKPVLEFISVQRTDNQEWSIPGGILRAGAEIYECLKAEFEPSGDLSKEQMQEKLTALWQTGTEIYEGYADDPRNTDNAWLETRAINYHDEEGKFLEGLDIKAGDSAELVRWQKISSKQSLYGGHLSVLKKVADKHTAAF